MPSTTWTLRTLTVIVALAPFDIGYLIGDFGTRLRPVMFVALAVPLIARLESRSRRVSRAGRSESPRIDWADRFLLAWLAAVWISTVLAADTINATAFAFRFTVLAAVIHGTRCTLAGGDALANASYLLHWFVRGTALAAIVGLVVLVSGGDPFPEKLMQGSVTRLGTVDRLTRPWTHANIAAMGLGAAVPTALVVRDRERAAMALPIVVALFLTYSRGAIVGFVASSVVVVVLARSSRVVARVALAAVVAVFLVAVAQGWEARNLTETDQTWFDAAIEHPAELSSLQDRPVTITAINNSSTPWLPDGSEAIELSARWIGPDPDTRERAVWIEQRWRLPDVTAPSETARWDLELAADLPAGTYDIYWDLLRDEEAYFLQFSDRSATTQWLVPAGDGAVPADDPVPFVLRVHDLDRQELWRVALEVFSDAPIFGVGPGQLPVGAATRIDEDQRVAGGHSHNLWLELLATVGGVGAAAFAGLVAVAVARLGARVRANWTRTDASISPLVRKRDVATAGALAALLAHGLVDLPLMFQGTAIPLGLFLGIALGSRGVEPRALTSDTATDDEESAQTSLRAT